MLRLSAVVVLASLSAFAADPVIVDSPDSPGESTDRCAPAIACTAKLEGDGVLGIEAGSDGRTTDGQLIHDGQMIFRFTASKNVELHLYTTPLILAGHAPRSVPAVQPGLKVALLGEEELLPGIDLSMYLTMPAADLEQTYDFEAWLGFSKTLGVVKASLTLMTAVGDVGGESTVQGLALLNLTSDLGHGVTLFGETFGTWGETKALPPGVGVATGVSFALGDSLAADVGTELAFHEQAMMTVFAGLTWTPHLAVLERPLPEPAPSTAASFLPGAQFVAMR